MARTGLYGFRISGDQKGREQIEGLKELQRELNKLGADAKNDMKPAHQEAAKTVAEASRPLAPVLTGRLAESLRASATKTSGRVRAGNVSVPYAGPIHFGWPARAIRANPFIYHALDERRADVVALYDKRMGEIIAKHGLQPGPATPPSGAHITPGTTL